MSFSAKICHESRERNKKKKSVSDWRGIVPSLVILIGPACTGALTHSDSYTMTSFQIFLTSGHAHLRVTSRKVSASRSTVGRRSHGTTLHGCRRACRGREHVPYVGGPRTTLSLLRRRRTTHRRKTRRTWRASMWLGRLVRVRHVCKLRGRGLHGARV